MIKVEFKVSTTKKYPYLGIYDNIIVLFIGIDNGICLSGQNIGWQNNWNEWNFTPYDKKIIISNE